MEFQTNAQPIFMQIYDLLCDRVLSGQLQPEQQIPSVRELAVQLEVNPNTVMRTFEYLQVNEIIYNRRGMGFFVAQDAREQILQLHKLTFLTEELPYLLQRMKLLGLTLDDLQQYF